MFYKFLMAKADSFTVRTAFQDSHSHRLYDTNQCLTQPVVQDGVFMQERASGVKCNESVCVVLLMKLVVRCLLQADNAGHRE